MNKKEIDMAASYYYIDTKAGIALPEIVKEIKENIK